VLLRAVLVVCAYIGKGAGEVCRHILPPIVRWGTTCLALVAIAVAAGHYAKIGTGRALACARSLADDGHALIAKASDDWQLGGAETPRAIPLVAAPAAPEARPEQATAFGRLQGLVSPLFPEGSEYPEPNGQPRIEGKVLEKAGGHEMQRLISEVRDAVREVESSSGKALQGDFVDGVPLAFGEYQTRREVTDDLKRIYGVTIDPRACERDPVLAEYSFRLYVGYYGRYYLKENGTMPTARDLCVTWNCGPDRGPEWKAE
jgi:hypothetical protein